jgi:3-oxoacyl-[acyl-carrier-protein] synthase II
MRTRVVVTGLGVVSCIGIGKDEFWDALIQGKSGISKVDAFDTSEHFTHYGGQVKRFRPQDFLDRKRIKLMGRASLMAIASTKMALKDAGIELKDLNIKRVAVLIGTTAGESQEIEKANFSWVKEGKDAIDIWTIIKLGVNNISANVARVFRIGGENRTFTTACSAGNYAISYGFDLLRLGKVDLVIAGGSDAFSYLAFTGFNQVRVVAPQICQPFDKNRKGMLVAEGAGILILETLEFALRRNANIYAEILGYGLSCDAYHMVNPHAEGMTQCINDALVSAGVEPSDVDYINAHGTGTIHNDRAECKAIKNIFGQRRVAVSSIKSMLGHAMGAASAIEAVSTALTVKNDLIPPTINYQTPDPECDIDCVPNRARTQKVHIALNNSFAFGGNNCCVVFSKFE